MIVLPQLLTRNFLGALTTTGFAPPMDIYENEFDIARFRDLPGCYGGNRVVVLAPILDTRPTAPLHI